MTSSGSGVFGSALHAGFATTRNRDIVISRMSWALWVCGSSVTGFVSYSSVASAPQLSSSNVLAPCHHGKV